MALGERLSSDAAARNDPCRAALSNAFTVERETSFSTLRPERQTWIQRKVKQVHQSL